MQKYRDDYVPPNWRRKTKYRLDDTYKLKRNQAKKLNRSTMIGAGVGAAIGAIAGNRYANNIRNATGRSDLKGSTIAKAGAGIGAALGAAIPHAYNRGKFTQAANPHNRIPHSGFYGAALGGIAGAALAGPGKHGTADPNRVRKGALGGAAVGYIIGKAYKKGRQASVARRRNMEKDYRGRDW